MVELDALLLDGGRRIRDKWRRARNPHFPCRRLRLISHFIIPCCEMIHELLFFPSAETKYELKRKKKHTSVCRVSYRTRGGGVWIYFSAFFFHVWTDESVSASSTRGFVIGGGDVIVSWWRWRTDKCSTGHGSNEPRATHRWCFPPRRGPQKIPSNPRQSPNESPKYSHD